MFYLNVNAIGTPPEINNNPFPFKLICSTFASLQLAHKKYIEYREFACLNLLYYYKANL